MKSVQMGPEHADPDDMESLYEQYSVRPQQRAHDASALEVQANCGAAVHCA